MKTLPLVILSTAVVLASCSSSKYAASSEYDDVYYNPNVAQRKATVPVATSVTPQEAMTAQPIVQAPVYAETQVYSDENLSDYERYQIQREAERYSRAIAGGNERIERGDDGQFHWLSWWYSLCWWS